MNEPHETSAGETGGREAMSDERLAEIRQIAADSRAVVARHLTAALRELLAEVLRLRANAEADWRGITTALDGWNEEAGNAWRAYAEQRQRAETAERELAEMRERIGREDVEWRAEQPSGAWNMSHTTPTESMARAVVETTRKLGYQVELQRRVVGEWKAVEEQDSTIVKLSDGEVRVPEDCPVPDDMLRAMNGPGHSVVKREATDG